MPVSCMHALLRPRERTLSCALVLLCCVLASCAESWLSDFAPDTLLATHAEHDGSTPTRFDPGRCATGPQFGWNREGRELAAFPDDTWTISDPTTATGLRIQIDAQTPWLRNTRLSRGLQRVYTDLSTLDGFGVNAGKFLRFDKPLAEPLSTVQDSLDNTALQLWSLQDPPVRVPFEAHTIDEGTSLLIHPLRPLQGGTRHLL